MGDQRARAEPGGSGRARARRSLRRRSARVLVALVLVLVVAAVVAATVLAGVVVLLVVGVGAGAALLTWGARTAVRASRPGSRRRAPVARPGQPSTRLPAHLSARHAAHPAVRAAALNRPPVRDLTLEELGREWQRTATALAASTDPATREVLARRRQEALDELERRDPAGIARWLSSGATVDDDPARHLRGDQAAGPGPS